jgi:hypothetical protein
MSRLVDEHADRANRQFADAPDVGHALLVLEVDEMQRRFRRLPEVLAHFLEAGHHLQVVRSWRMIALPRARTSANCRCRPD